MIVDGAKIASISDIGDMRVFATKEDMKKTCEIAMQYNCKSVFGLKCYADYMKSLIQGSPVGLEFSICNNAGSDDTAVKVAGARRYLEMGLDEVEMYLNFSYFKSKMYKECVADIRAVRDVMPKDMIMKVIIQSPALNDEEIATASKIVIDGGADFVKTANGEFGCTTVHQVEVISKAIGNSGKIKCSIPENLDTVYQWLDIPGVERLGLTTWGFLDLYNEANARCGK